MFASFLAVAGAVYIFFRYDRHRFRALYAGVVCAILLPILTAIFFSIELFMEDMGFEGFFRESVHLLVNSLMAPLDQIRGADVPPTVVFPGWLMITAIVATGIRFFSAPKKRAD
jgi:hypothetical protein